MRTLSVSETRKQLPSLLAEIAEKCDAIIITRHGKPLAKLVACTADDTAVVLHPLRGLPIGIAEDFDESLTADWEALLG